MVASCVGSLHAIALSLQNSLSSNDVCVRVSVYRLGMIIRKRKTKEDQTRFLKKKKKLRDVNGATSFSEERIIQHGVSLISKQRESPPQDWTGQDRLPCPMPIATFSLLPSFLPST